jgi:FkbM family methyltransferase
MNLARLTTKISTAHRVLRSRGITGVIDVMKAQADLRARLAAARHVKSVILDGCTFGLDRVPNTPMKAALLDQSYEAFERRAVQKYVDPELPVIELGGCIGVVSCITNHLLRNPRLHVVVEANPNAIPLLEAHRNRNGCGFEVVNAAIAYCAESVTFLPASDFCSNTLVQRSAEAEVTVPAVHLGDIAGQRKFERFSLICDIEGHESDLVLNEIDVLRKANIVILETHARIIGENKNRDLLRKLEETGLKMVDQDSYVVVMSRSAS